MLILQDLKVVLYLLSDDNKFRPISERESHIIMWLLNEAVVVTLISNQGIIRWSLPKNQSQYECTIHYSEQGKKTLKYFTRSVSECFPDFSFPLVAPPQAPAAPPTPQCRRGSSWPWSSRWQRCPAPLTRTSLVRKYAIVLHVYLLGMDKSIMKVSHSDIATD